MARRNMSPPSEKSLFSGGVSYLPHFVFLFFISLTVIVLDHKYKKLEPVHSWLNTALYPVYFTADMPSHLNEWVQNRLVSKDTLLSESYSLNERNLFLSHKLQKYEMLEVENNRLRSLLNMSNLYRYDRVQISSVLRLDHSKNKNELILDKGLRDHVYIGQLVLDDKGLLGQIVHVAYNTSTLLLLDSTRHYTPVQIVRNSYHSMLVGNGSLQALKLLRVKEGTDLLEGDILITSGLGGVFPKGYKVGKVTSITYQEDNFLSIEVEPFSKHQKVEEVLLIWPTEDLNQTDKSLQKKENAET